MKLPSRVHRQVGGDPYGERSATQFDLRRERRADIRRRSGRDSERRRQIRRPKWIDGWNSTDPEVLVTAFTPDGVYEEVTFGLKKKGSAELRDLHKFFHESVGGLYVKLVSTHVANGYGTIEWIFGGRDVGVFKTGKPFAVRGVSVIEVRGNRISRNLDYYDAATIMKQVGKLPAA
ncbi:MAG: nuclear transport factor 2 family protein [Alphaproteobacteria bacterium]|nr:nuclear transport factor 2 family protein [Alphaproteobacteria bacterium]